MGDRANVVIRERYPDDLGPKEAVFLYSHWGGYELPETLRQALVNGRGRWDDEAYLARIVFDGMIGDQQGGETGFGISTRLTDNEYDLIVLYQGRVYRVPEGSYVKDGFVSLDLFSSVSFEEYVSVERTWENLTTAEIAADDDVMAGSS